jgi:hypothetical protein
MLSTGAECRIYTKIPNNNESNTQNKPNDLSGKPIPGAKNGAKNGTIQVNPNPTENVSA